jgi:hypothetical protein
MDDADGISPWSRFYLGCFGSAAPWIFRLAAWLVTRAGNMSPSTPLPEIGGLYLLTVVAAGVGILLCVLLGGLWSYSLAAHQKWLAVYHGATAPHIFLFIFGGSFDTH